MKRAHDKDEENFRRNHITINAAIAHDEFLFIEFPKEIILTISQFLPDWNLLQLSMTSKTNLKYLVNMFRFSLFFQSRPELVRFVPNDRL